MKKFGKIAVIFERREDGGLRAYSNDVPGFVLSHTDVHGLCADIKPALEMILSEMLGVAVTVEPLMANLLNDLEEAGLIYDLPKQRRVTREYVGEMAAA